MKAFRCLLSKTTTFELFGVPKVTLHAGKVFTTEEVPESVVLAIQGMTPEKIFEPVDLGAPNFISEEGVTPPTVKEVIDGKAPEATYDSMPIDDLRLKCDERGITYSMSNNAKQLIKKLMEQEVENEHE